MKTIFKIQVKSLQKEYGFMMYFFLLYQFGGNIIKMLILSLWGLISWYLIDNGYLTQSIYEHLVVVVVFLLFFLFKKEKQYALAPYITKLPVHKIKNYILVRELFSIFNFSLLSFIVPVLFLNKTIEKSDKTYILVLINLWLMGLLLNMFTRIVKYFCIKYKSYFIATLSIVFTYFIFLVLYRTSAIFSYSYFLDNTYIIIVLLTGSVFLTTTYFSVIKQELYRVYDGKHIGNEFTRLFYSALISNNIFNKLHILEFLRCKVFIKIFTPMIFFIIIGMFFYLSNNLKLFGLMIYLGAYTMHILHFTISLNSEYFDGLYTKPVSIRSLLLNAFYTHIIIITILFIPLLIYMTMYDKPYILPYTSIYVFLSGPVAFILLHGILFAKKFDLYPVQSDYSIRQSFAQKTIRIIAGISSLGSIAIIHFFSTIGCYIVLTTSMFVIITYPYWIEYLYKQFMRKKYQIMENLRKNSIP